MSLDFIGTCKYSKISNTFSNKYLVSMAGIHKMPAHIANRGDPDQTASSDLGLRCFVYPFLMSFKKATTAFQILKHIQLCNV